MGRGWSLRRLGAWIVAAIMVSSAGPALARDDAQAALASFREIAARYQSFFATPRYEIVNVKDASIGSGSAYWAEVYAAKSVVFDVQHTESLISPFIAYVEVVFIDSTANRPCGTYPSAYTSGVYKGWDSAASAIASTKRPECWPTREMYDYPMRFNYAYQDGHWVLKSVIRQNSGKPERGLTLLLMGVPNDDLLPPTPDGVAYNAPWKALSAP